MNADWLRPKVTGDIKIFLTTTCTASRQVQDLIAQTFSALQKQKVKTYYLFSKTAKTKNEDFFQACLQEEHLGVYWDYLSVELRSLSKNAKENQLKLKGISSQKPYQTCLKRTLADHLQREYFTESLEYQEKYVLQSNPILMINNQIFYRDKSVKIMNIPAFNNPQTKDYLKLKDALDKKLGICELKPSL